MTSYQGLQIVPESRPPWGVWPAAEIQSGLSSVIAGAVIAFLVYRFVRRVPWPRRLNLPFLLFNLAAAIATSLLWVGLSIAFESVFTGSLLNTRTGTLFWQERIVMGLFLYAVIAAITYPVEAAARAARAESAAARTQLAALRAQIQPHFLFNALHAVAQLIPLDPSRAVDAAELIGDLLRATVDETRDEVTLDEEWRFVSRYLALERIRFGDRLVIRSDFAAGILEARIPAFALQTLVENAVRHGAARRVEATEIVINGTGSASELTLSVRNTNNGVPAPAAAAGTGLVRLRERLRVLYGGAASLTAGPAEHGGYEAVLVVPRTRGSEA